jgi:organic hydroperoxide reductase OsmC/OhrA
LPENLPHANHLRGAHAISSRHTAIVRWQHAGTEFLRGKYSREHSWTFDGGLTVPASSSPSVVRPPYSNPANVDPEEAFVAAISSCHMLTFLYVAAKAGFEVGSYVDEAVGTMSSNANGVPWVSRVALSPKIVYLGAKTPSALEEARLHEQAHHDCFISNSVKTEIVIA